jgi:hypothetical protein
MLFKTIRTTTLIACLLATLFTMGAGSRAQAQSPSAPCPAGWGHGSFAGYSLPGFSGTDLESTKLGCGGGVADLITFDVDESARDREPIGQFDYDAPSHCVSPTGVYIIVVQAKESDYAQMFEVRDPRGHVNFYLDAKYVAYGPQPLYVRISSGICHAEAIGTFEIIAANVEGASAS